MKKFFGESSVWFVMAENRAVASYEYYKLMQEFFKGEMSLEECMDEKWSEKCFVDERGQIFLRHALEARQKDEQLKKFVLEGRVSPEIYKEIYGWDCSL